MRILFSDGKFLDIDSNSQNDRVWVVSRADIDKRVATKISTESNGLIGRLFQERNAVGDFE